MHDVRVNILFIKKLNKNGKRDKIHAEGNVYNTTKDYRSDNYLDQI